MATYHQVNAQALETFLTNLGFVRGVQNKEVVYTKTSAHNPNVHIKVYTSVRVGDTSARAKGADAIRVCTVWDNGERSFGIGKFPKVLRTTSDEAVTKRVRDRIEMARLRAIEYMDKHGYAG